MIFRLYDPVVLGLLLLVPVILAAGWLVRQHRSQVRFSNTQAVRKISGAVSSRPIWIPKILRITALILLIVAAARPQAGEEKEVIYSQGIDIILALDISGSMQALDFQPQNRLEAAKQIMSGFIQERTNDRIGLVLFGSESFTLCPLTLDHDLLRAFLKQARIGMVEENTAIGKALTTAINRLRVDPEEIPHRLQNRSETVIDAQSKIVILCTDGVNTVQSEIDPITAAKAAKALGIKVYTIGVGTNGLVPFPDPRNRRYVRKIPAELDEDLLREIADVTGGQYFPAQNETALKRIFDIIDDIEKMEIESFKYTRYKELFFYFAIPGLLLLLLELILRQSLYRRFP